MADVTGPISSLPGSHHKSPKGMMCDNEENHPVPVLAVMRIQGETDSMGCEMHDYCQACLDKQEAALVTMEAEPCQCEWCKSTTTDCKPMRDINEGSCGRLYDVCRACRKKENDALQAELEEEEPLPVYYHDDHN